LNTISALGWSAIKVHSGFISDPVLVHLKPCKHRPSGLSDHKSGLKILHRGHAPLHLTVGDVSEPPPLTPLAQATEQLCFRSPFKCACVQIAHNFSMDLAPYLLQSDSGTRLLENNVLNSEKEHHTYVDGLNSGAGPRVQVRNVISPRSGPQCYFTTIRSAMLFHHDQVRNVISPRDQVRPILGRVLGCPLFIYPFRQRCCGCLFVFGLAVVVYP